VVGDDEAEHGVAEELEALVRALTGVLGAPRAVDERGAQVPRREQGVTDAIGEALATLLGVDPAAEDLVRRVQSCSNFAVT
jgi:hypothetical protein